MQQDKLANANLSGKTKYFSIYVLNAAGELTPYDYRSAFHSILNDTNKGLLIYSNPAQLIANHNTPHSNPASILQSWTHEAKVYLSLLRKYRRNFLVLERSSIRNEEIESAFHAGFPGQMLPNEITTPHLGASRLDLHTAYLSILQNSDAKALLNELQASSGAQSNKTPTKEACIKIIANEAAKLKKLSQEQVAANSMLIAQVHQLQNSLANSSKMKRSLDQEVIKLTAELKAVRSELTLVYQSTSWKITKVIRAAKRLLKK